MYQAPDFIKVGLKVKTAFANTSSCQYDEFADHTIGQGPMDVCDGSYFTMVDKLGEELGYMCFTVHDL